LVERFILSIALFQRRIPCGHGLCIGALMPNPFPPPGTGVEPTPNFASTAEIELAEQLRHKLEERYLEASGAPASLQSRSGENH
jgi:hypothetical protein